MKQMLFGSIQWKPHKTKHWLFLPLSLFIHASVLASLVVVPLLEVDSNLPQVKEFGVLLVSPAAIPAPGVPGRRGNPKGTPQPKDRPDSAPKPPPAKTGILIAPLVIPDTIDEEEIFDPDLGPGFDDRGIVDGFEEGDGDIMGRDLFPTKSDDIVFTPVEKPRLIKKVIPKYPEIALKVRATDTVIIEATTDCHGRVSDARVVKGHPLLNQAALDSVRRWIYEPYLINGIPKPVRFTVTITFRLDST
jgi:TonB family protein